MPLELYGLHGTLRATPGQRDALLAILLEAAKNAPAMPGCRVYVVSRIPDDADAIAVTEIWDDKASHDASLSLESVREIIGRARPLIVGTGGSQTFAPVGGLGLDRAERRIFRARDEADSERG